LEISLEITKEKKEKLFEKPVLLILAAICLITLGLIVEVFINNSNTEAQKKNIYELNNLK
jgi:uncharacterized membrane protein